MEQIGTVFTDYHGYKIDESGRIFNKDGVTLKKLKINKKGYPFTNFWYEGRAHCHLAHTFVWRALRGDIPYGYEVDHIDNDRLNFEISNLQLLSKSANNKKAYDSGNRMFLFGDTNPNSHKRKGKK